LISSTAAASAVLEPSDPSWQNNTGLFTAQPPVASITKTRVRVLRGGTGGCDHPTSRAAQSIQPDRGLKELSRSKIAV
jgi:hypothetical protein